MIPGINILNIALSVIGSQPVVYYRDSGAREELPNGVLLTRFEPGRAINRCSVQAIPKEKRDQRGLDVASEYVEWFVPRTVTGVERDASGDQIEWDGKRWQIVGSLEKWAAQDGWCSAVCQEVKSGN